MIQMTKEEFIEASNDLEGVCLACGETTCYKIEQDAEFYECESCEKKQVFGYEQALICGYIDFIDDLEDSED